LTRLASEKFASKVGKREPQKAKEGKAEKTKVSTAVWVVFIIMALSIFVGIASQIKAGPWL
jgi:hypothetical protein